MAPHLPDVLVLGGGGTLGEAWMMGLLSGYEDHAGLDLRKCEYFVGTSAGSIVAAHLVAGRSPRRPDQIPDETAPGDTASEAQARRLADAGASAARLAGEAALRSAATFAPLALGVAAPGGAVLRAALLRRLPHPSVTLDALREHVERGGARFDGRLRVTAVDKDTGRRVVFGSPGAPDATVAEAVAASCAVPWIFEPVRIDGRTYVDGGVWSPTNLDIAPAGRGAEILCLNPTANLRGAGDMISLFRRVSRSAASIETLALRRRGAHVTVVGPDASAARTMGINLMDRSRAKATLSAGYAQGRALAAG
jgi:NTE family protein